MEPMKPMQPMKPMEPMDFGPLWWPKDLGQPTTSGAQNGARYAFFAQPRRLLVERDGTLPTYDTAEHEISGVSQGSQEGSLAFTSRTGAVKLDDLKKVD